MKMTNEEIYTHAAKLAEAFQDSTQRLPVKVNFYIQKNKNTLLPLGQNIEESRMEIIRNFGQPAEDGESYIIPDENVESAQKELNDLFTLEQEVDIYKVSIDSFPEDISLTTGQMDAIMFMID